MEPLLLNSGDRVTLEVLLAQTETRNEIKVETRIVGLKQPRNFEFLPRSIFFPLGRILTFILYLAFLLLVIFLILSKYENDLIVKVTTILMFLLIAILYIVIFVVFASFGYSFIFRTGVLDGFKFMSNQLMLLIKYMIYGAI